MSNDRPSAEESLFNAPLHPDNALACPDCGIPTEVKDSRPRQPHGFSTTVRRRHCSGCDKRFTTLEVQMATYERLLGLPARLVLIRRTLNDLSDQINRINE